MKRSLYAALLVATGLTPCMASAQEAQPAPDDLPPAIQDIVVTARKVKESLSDAPVAVSAVTAQKIEALGLTSIDDFAKQATGVSFSQAFGRTSDRPVIRGQSNVLANVQFGVETGAAYFVDGIYYQGDIQSFDPTSIERVEIIKGPQSALYGRNTYAGAINYITKDASTKFTGNLRLTAAQYGEYQVAGSVSGPIIPDVLGFRLGGRHYQYGGQYRNQLNGQKIGQERTDSIYLTLDWGGGGDLKVRQRFSYQHDRDGSIPFFLQGAAANNCMPGYRSAAYRTRSFALPYVANTLGTSTNTNQYFCGTIQPQPNMIQMNDTPMQTTIPAGSFIPSSFNTSAISGVFDGTAFDGNDNRQYYVSQVVDWNIGGSGWVLSSLTGYRKNYNRFGSDGDHSDAFFYFSPNPALMAGLSPPNPLVSEPAFAGTTRKDTWDISQELRLATPQDRPLSALVGLYYFKQKQIVRDLTFANPFEGEALGTLGSGINWVEDRAVFGSVTWKPLQGLSISGEVRYAEERKRQIDYSTSPLFCAGYAGETTAFGSFTSTNCQNELLEKGTDPRVTIDYQFPGGLLLYGIYARGRKPGGFNGAAGVTATNQTGHDSVRYLPEKVEAFEIGAKFSALDHRLRGSVSLYHNKLTNIQLTSSLPDLSTAGSILSFVSNQGNGVTQGVEVEFTAAPTRNLTVTMGASYVDAHFTSGCDADLFTLNSGGLKPNFDTSNPPAAALPYCSIAGKKLPLGSPWIVNGSVSYELPVGEDVAVMFNTNFSYEASKYIQVDNLAKTGDAFLLNARIGVRIKNFTLTAFGRNLTDEDSIPMATRWFDYRYGYGTTGLPAASTVTFNGSSATIDNGAPRAFFAALRKGRTFGVELGASF
ncbi:MAG: TonB-dependent receptor plug domain-containing protein [Novosphingobium sp.]